MKVFWVWRFLVIISRVRWYRSSITFYPDYEHPFSEWIRRIVS